MFKYRIEMALCLMFFLIMFSGCQTTQVPAGVTVSPDVPPSISFSEIRMIESDTGRLHANMEVYSNCRNVRRLRYRAEWYTEDGFRLDSVMSRWTDFTIPPRGAYTIQVVAPDRTAAECRIYIRKGGL